jgi:hypothetical protein
MEFLTSLISLTCSHKRIDHHTPNPPHHPEHHQINRNYRRDQGPHTRHARHADEVPVQGDGDARMGGYQRERSAWMAREGMQCNANPSAAQGDIRILLCCSCFVVVLWG